MNASARFQPGSRTGDNIIPLEEVLRRRAHTPADPQRPLSLPNTVVLNPAPAHADLPHALPRRRRIPTVKKWLPTALLVMSVLVLAVVFVAIRVLLGTVFPAPSEAPVAAGPRPEAVDLAVASVPPADVVIAPSIIVVQPTTAAAVEATPPRQIKMVTRVVEPTYVVVAGDNLWSIAQRHNTSPEAVQAINNLPDRPILSVGQRLVLP